MTSEVDLRAFLTGFVAEAEDHLRTCRAALMDLDRAHEQGSVRPRAVRDLYRALHTLKGLSAMVEVQPLVDLTHHMETVLREAEQAGGILSGDALGVLVAALGAVEQRVGELARDQPASPAPDDILRRLDAVHLDAAGAVASAPGLHLRLERSLTQKLSASERNQITEGVRAGQRAVRLTFVPSSARASEGLNITSVRERVGALGELVRVLPVSVERSDAAPGGLAFVLLVLTDADDETLIRAAGLETGAVEPLVEDLEPPSEEPELDIEEAQGAFVRVGVDRLERTFAHLGAIIVTQHRVERALDALETQGVDVRQLRHAADEHRRRMGDLRGSILELRMVRVGEVLEPLPLLVRGLGATTGKTVQLELDLARTELDKTVAETIFPALVQLVRNAVDHGIEAPAARRAAGKNETGQITIRAADLGTGMLELSVSDDGGGVNIRELAQRAGAPLPTSDDELLALMVRPGVSTRREADHTSGRGMGMDIVERRVRRLGGELRLIDRGGEGTTFVLRVPLTVTIIDALRFTCAEQAFVTPLASVEEVLEVRELSLRVAPDPLRRGATRLFAHGGEVVSYLPLLEAFGLPCGESSRAVLVRRGGRCVAFGVDHIVGLSELVVRPIDDPLAQVPGVAGSTDLGDGRATLVLDLPALAARFDASSGPSPREATP